MHRVLSLALLTLLAAVSAASQPAVTVGLDLRGDMQPFASELKTEAAVVVDGGVILAAATRDSVYVARVTADGVEWSRAHATGHDELPREVSLRATTSGLAVGLALGVEVGYEVSGALAGDNDASADLVGMGLRLDSEGREVSRTPLLTAGLPAAVRDAPDLPEPWNEKLFGVFGLDTDWILVTTASLQASMPDSSAVSVGAVAVSRWTDAGVALWNTPVSANPGLDTFIGPTLAFSNTDLLVGLRMSVFAQGMVLNQIVSGAVELETGVGRPLFESIAASNEFVDTGGLAAVSFGDAVWHTYRNESESRTVGSRRDRRRTITETTLYHTLHRSGAEPVTWADANTERIPSSALCPSPDGMAMAYVPQGSDTLYFRTLGGEAGASDPVELATLPVPSGGGSLWTDLLACGASGDTTWVVVQRNRAATASNLQGTHGTAVYAIER